MCLICLLLLFKINNSVKRLSLLKTLSALSQLSSSSLWFTVQHFKCLTSQTARLTNSRPDLKMANTVSYHCFSSFLLLCFPESISQICYTRLCRHKKKRLWDLVAETHTVLPFFVIRLLGDSSAQCEISASSWQLPHLAGCVLRRTSLFIWWALSQRGREIFSQQSDSIKLNTHGWKY